MPYVKALRCRECAREYPVEPLNVCEFCFGPLEVTYDYKAISKVLTKKRISQGPLTMWRYADLLPVDAEKAIAIPPGFTPLIKSKTLGRMLGLTELYLKNDSVNPSYSFKDRVVSVAITKSLEFEYEAVACASTGNLACSVAAHAARAGIKAYVFIPSDLERGKVIGTAIYGPTIVAVKGSYDQVNRLCSEISDNYHWAFVNINMRPYYSEGSKTLGYEVAEQLGWRAPDHAIVPAASGSLYTKIWKGFNELADLGLIGPVKTRMHLTQAEGCAPIAEAFLRGDTHIRPVKPNTIAKSLGIGNPADGFYALKVAKASGGTAYPVREEDVFEGIKLLAETEGIFTETAGGVVISGLKNLAKAGLIGKDDVTVAYITGNGLKTQEVVEGSVRLLNIEPNMKSFETALNGRAKT